MQREKRVAKTFKREWKKLEDVNCDGYIRDSLIIQLLQCLQNKIESQEQIDAFLKRARFGCLRSYQHHSVFFMHVRVCAWTLHSDGFSIFTYPR